MSEFIRIAKELLDHESRAINSLAAKLDSSFEAAVHLIANCKGRIIISGIGKSGHVGKKIAASFCSIGISSYFIHPSEASHGDLGAIQRDDLVIVLSKSGESIELFDLVNYCRGKLIQTIAIIAVQNSSLCNSVDLPLLIPDGPEGTDLKAPLTSAITTLALGDALFACLVKHLEITNAIFSKYHPGGKIGTSLMLVKDIMHTGSRMPIVKRDEKMVNVIITMTTKSLGCAIVEDADGNIAGIISDGDLRRHVKTNLLDLYAEEVMTKNPIHISEDALAIDALEIMNKKKITFLVVTHRKKLIGILHLHDCIKLGLKCEE